MEEITKNNPAPNPGPSGEKRKVVRKQTPKIVKQRPPAVRLYRRIAFSFTVITLLTLALVAYLSFVRADIKIYPEPKTISADFAVDVVKSTTAANQVEGKIVERIYEKTGEFSPSAEGVTVPAKAGGEVTIYNNYSQNQPLVASTRLLSPDGKLFRIDETVTVPAGGQVTVMAHADEEGPEYEIEPTRFTIPGLWQGLQDQIYAESDQPMTGGEVTVVAVSQDDLDRAEQELSDQMFEQIKQELLAEASDPRFGGHAFSYQVIEKISDTAPGEEKENFTIKIKISVIGAFFNQKQINEVIKAKIEETLSSDYIVGEVIKDETKYSVNDYNLESGVANVIVDAAASVRIHEASQILDKQKITGLSVDDARSYLAGSPMIRDVEIKTRPFWIGRLPNLEDHIVYEIVGSD